MLRRASGDELFIMVYAFNWLCNNKMRFKNNRHVAEACGQGHDYSRTKRLCHDRRQEHEEESQTLPRKRMLFSFIPTISVPVLRAKGGRGPCGKRRGVSCDRPPSYSITHQVGYYQTPPSYPTAQ